MMAVRLVLVWAVLALVVAKKAKIERSEGIYILTEENYDKAVKENEYLLVYFYAPWLGFPPSFPFHPFPTPPPFIPPKVLVYILVNGVFPCTNELAQ